MSDYWLGVLLGVFLGLGLGSAWGISFVYETVERWATRHGLKLWE